MVEEFGRKLKPTVVCNFYLAGEYSACFIADLLKSVNVPFIFGVFPAWKFGMDKLYLCSGVSTLFETMLEHSVGLIVVLS